MKKNKILSFVIFFLVSIQLLGQSSHQLRKDGDDSYQEKEFQTAEENYRKSLQAEKSLKGTYNLGNSVYNQARFSEAADYFNNSLEYTKDDLTKSRIYYNMGNALLKEDKVAESIDAYKEALKLNPGDLDAKKNLYLAKRVKKQQEEEEKEKQENQDQNQENQNQEQQESQDNQQQQQQETNQPQENQQQQQQQQQEKQHGEKQGLSKEDAAKLLEVIESEEKKVQEKMRKVSADKKKIEKDW